MLTETRPTDTADIWEISGETSEVIDSETLSAAARIAAEAALGLQASRGADDWITLFRALADLTAEHAAAGDPQPRFSLATLREKCAEIDPGQKLYWRSEEDTSRKKFSTAWDKLVKAFPGLEANLRQRAEKQRVAGRVLPDSAFDGQDKRSRLFCFVLLAVELQESREPLPIPATRSEDVVGAVTEIEYIEEMEVYPIPGIRRPLRINVRGWRAAYLLAPVFAFLALTALGGSFLIELWLSDLPVRAVFIETLSLAIILGAAAWLAWPLMRLLDDRIICAPLFMQINSLHEHVLIIKREGQAKTLHMVRFTAICPYCGGLVEIHKGRGIFRGRLVGECGENPVEHIFSFDHILRRGRCLRT